MTMSQLTNPDANLDYEMLLSDFEEDGRAKNTTFLMPKACLLVSGLVEQGADATAAETCGDGACSLHSIWGSVIPTPSGNMYYCENARQKLCNSMPVDVTDMLSTRCGDAVRRLLDSMLSDAVGSCMRLTRKESLTPGDSMGIGVFWKHLA